VADINIERRPNNRWPWIIGIIAIVLIAAGIIFYFEREEGWNTTGQEEAVANDTLRHQPADPYAPQPAEPAPGQP
jgi:hypothetical protein